MPRWGLYTNGVARDELTPHGDCAKDDLETIEEVLPDDNDSLTPSCPSFTRRDRLDLRYERTNGVQTVGPVQTTDLAAVFAVVVDEHVLTEAEQRRGVHVEARRHGHLEPPHVAWISRIFQAILVTLEEKFKLEPKKRKLNKYSCLDSDFEF